MLWLTPGGFPALWGFGMAPGMSLILRMCLKRSPLPPGAFTTIPSGL